MTTDDQSAIAGPELAEVTRYAVLADVGKAVRNSVEIVRALRRIKRRGGIVPTEVMNHSQGRCQMARELYRAIRQQLHNAGDLARKPAPQDCDT